MELIETDVCVIGAGSGGLAVAFGAAETGKDVVLVEKAELGGDSVKFGSVPSKALIAAGRAAQAQRSGAALGIVPIEPHVDGARVMAHVRETIQALMPLDAKARLESAGVKIIRAEARFLDQRTLDAGGRRVRARRFVVAAGSRPQVPQLPGLENVSWFTTETIFGLESIPSNLVVIGGGAVGLELAQAFQRLGAKVTVIDSQRMLPQYERALSQPVFDALLREGMLLREGAKINAIERAPGDGVRVQIARVQGPETIEGTHLLLATGRLPNIEQLGLDKAKVATDAKGIKVDSTLKTSNPRVCAIGDVAGAPQFAHVAANHASLILRNFQFRLPAHSSYDAAPEVLYTDPEVAHVGLRQADAEKRKLRFEIVTVPLDETDRGRIDRIGESVAKLLVGRSGRILGASIVAPSAGELILPWVMAISEGVKLSRLASLIVPYPTLGDHIKRAAAAYYAPQEREIRTHFLSGALARLG
jgi:pyruvate/2-oxoglutarate dehydrogenase complex dihydrolipoamide dehydrogenase (E3) component